MDENGWWGSGVPHGPQETTNFVFLLRSLIGVRCSPMPRKDGVLHAIFRDKPVSIYRVTCRLRAVEKQAKTGGLLCFLLLGLPHDDSYDRNWGFHCGSCGLSQLYVGRESQQPVYDGILKCQNICRSCRWLQTENHHIPPKAEGSYWHGSWSKLNDTAKDVYRRVSSRVVG